MDYENVPRDLAQALRMNYVFGVEFIELNRIYIGLKKLDIARPAAEAGYTFGVDPSRYLGLEGTAMLSRFPIRDARIVRLPPEYDWYSGEIKALTEMQKLENWAAEKLFTERVKRQVRRGSRMALVVDLEVPQSPTGLVTVVCPHLEDYTDPRGRRAQADYLLSHIKQISNPVIVAGDFNTMGHNTHPQIGNWLKGLFSFVGPVPGLKEVMNPINHFKNLHDPTAGNIRVLAPNHERPLFNDVHRFRFADGGQFEWNGEKDRSFQHRRRTLSDSSQRAGKGFASTFFFARTDHGLVGEYKLDWFFIKPPLTEPHKTSAAIQLAPFFGRTLRETNTALGKRTSDHCPITLDLLLTEPVAGNISAAVGPAGR
jgi:exonuclease III